MTIRIACGLAIIGVMVAGTPVRLALAADAAHPYSNIDRSVDAGNDTGDSQVDRLNQQQLDRGAAQGTNSQWRRPAQDGQGYGGNAYGGQAYGGARPAPGYYRPAPGYYPRPPVVVAVRPYGWRRRWWWRHHWVYAAPVYP